MNIKRTPSASQQLGALLLALLSFTPAQSVATLSQVPLYTITSVQPNIFFLNDDSDSMDYEMLIDDTANEGRLAHEDTPALTYTDVSGIKTLKDTVYQYSGCSFSSGTLIGYAFILQRSATDICDVAAEEEWRVRFHEINPLYYDPSKTYNPWLGKNPNDLDASGNPRDFQNMTLTSAWIEPAASSTATNNTIDLTNESAILVTTSAASAASAASTASTTSRTHYDTSTWEDWCATALTTYTPGDKTACSGWRYYYRDADNKIRLQWVKDLATEAEKTNFANWFTYHRSRKNVAKYAIGKTVENASGKRIGYGAINDISNGNFDDVALIANDNNAVVQSKLYNTLANGETPLQKSLQWVGDYYEVTAGETLKSPILDLASGGACQLNSTILMTDGFYSGSGAYKTTTTIGNADGDNSSPYADVYSSTLGDIAMHYYERDLAADDTLYPDKMKISSNNPDKAEHQHMNTYTISFGLKGTIDTSATLGSFTWPNTFTSTSNDPLAGISLAPRIDDLYHAAINSRSRYFDATNPDELVEAIDNIVSGMPQASNSSNRVATSSFRLDNNQRVFYTGFDSSDWSGWIKALSVNADGTLNENNPVWSSDSTLPFGASRTIITYDGATGIPFQLSNLKTAGLASLLGSTDAIAGPIVNYLRGEQMNSGTFRERGVPLGDIVNSSPVYIGPPSLLYPDADPFGVSSARYSQFWSAHKTRSPMLYVGANDGMLHGFKAADGTELLAYAPKATFDKLTNITQKSFTAAHKYYVDQTPTVSDAYIKTSLEAAAWRTVLVSGLGAGGRGLFALDVTDPSASFFSESNADKIALWEFSNSDDSDLGYTLAKPLIVMTENNKWAVIAGNGYGSDSGDAALFILDLDADASDGWTNDYKKMVTGDQTDNGLFSPAAVDSDGNGKVDHVYAGDLQGNLWVFDLSDTSNTSNWSSKKLFTAINSSGTAQPITTKPTVIRHPTQPTLSGNKPNLMVLFGTGRYLDSGDLSNTDGQSFYAVWDNGTANLTRANLVAQTTTTGLDSNHNIDARLTQNQYVDYSTKFGWYLDLQDQDTATNALIPGERVISSAVVHQGIVFFTTHTPSELACDSGGNSWFMFLKVDNGAPPDTPIISINNDRIVDPEADRVNLDGTTNTTPSGLRINGAIGTGPSVNDTSITIGAQDGLKNYAYKPNISADFGKRISWRELRAE